MAHVDYLWQEMQILLIGLDYKINYARSKLSLGPKRLKAPKFRAPKSLSLDRFLFLHFSLESIVQSLKNSNNFSETKLMSKQLGNFFQKLVLSVSWQIGFFSFDPCKRL